MEYGKHIIWPILMKKRKTVDYKKVFSKLKKEAIKNNLILKPKQIMTDMEYVCIKRIY